MKQGIAYEVIVMVVVSCLLPLGFCRIPPEVYRGCYLDGDGEQSLRVMTDLILCDDMNNACQDSCGPLERYCESDDKMTIQLCRSLCRTKNFQYYGLEGGNQCFCGGAFAKPFDYGVPEDNARFNCSDPCTGNSSQSCGGEFRLEIYEFKDPVEDPGCFFPGAVPYAIVTDVGVGVGETLTFTCEPGYELGIGESTLTCVANRTWSPKELPVCNYTGVFPETTTELPTTLSTTTELPTTLSTSTGEPTTQTPSTTSLSESTSSDAVGKPDPTTKPGAPKTTMKVVPTNKPRTFIEDYLPYIIGGAAGLLILLVVIMVLVFTCKLKKRAGNANQDISLKPDNLAPVTLLTNTGFVAGDDPEAANMPDVLLALETRPEVVQNEYVNHEISTFSPGEDGASSSDDSLGKDPQANYEDMNRMSRMELNPIYDGGDEFVKDSSDTVKNEKSSDGNPAEPAYEQMDGGKWDSRENLISLRTAMADLTETNARRLIQECNVNTD